MLSQAITIDHTICTDPGLDLKKFFTISGFSKGLVSIP